MPQGTVKSVICEKGYGWIQARLDRTGHRVEVFFHISGLSPGLVFDETLRERYVNFEVEKTSRGLVAVNVRPAYADQT
jgi:cold shock CspA family protein